MGKGTIVSGGTGGYYSISVQLDATAIAARIVDLQARLVDLQSKITEAEGTLNDLEDDFKALIAEQNALIDAFAADGTADNLKAIIDKSKEVAAAAAQVGLQKSAVAALVAEEASVRKEITRLSAAPSSVAAGAWCADYTEDLAGDVGVVTVPGGEREQHLQILPGYEGGAAYDATRDGMLRQPYTDSAAATYYNLAMLPGWQRWLPRYRLATITAIDTDLDTCSITISPAISGQQGIDVNYLLQYDDVPIEYMSCNSSAFEVSDTVIVEFTAQDKAGIEGNWAPGKPKVIGFVTDPRACTVSAFIIERGLAMIDASVLRIYAGTDSASYFASAGETWSWAYTAQAQGIYTESGIALEWTGPPTLDVKDSYPHTLWSIPGADPGEVSATLTAWTDSANRDPVTHTGLIRFLVQSMQANYDNTRLVPSGWIPYDSRWYGLMRQRDTTIGVETLRYWLVSVSSSGVWAVALEPDDVVSVLVSDLYAGNYSSEQKLSAEATVLSALRLPEGATGTQLLTETQMDDAHGGGFGPLKHGWHFSPQMWGTSSQDSTNAIMLAIKVEEDESNRFYWLTRKCTLRFTFAGETISASLSAEDDETVSLFYAHNLWTASGSLYIRKNLVEYAAPQGGTIWGCYWDDGPEWVTYVYETEDPAKNQTYRGGLGSCGGGGASHDITVSSVGIMYGGGFSGKWGEVSHVSESETKEIAVLRSGGSGSVTGVLCSTGGAQLDGIPQGQINFGSGVGSDPIECFEGAYVTDASGPGATMLNAEVTIQTADIVFELSYPQYKTGGLFGAAMLITRDPTVFITANQWGKRLSSDWIVNTWERSGYATSASWSGENGGGSASLAWGVYSGISDYGPTGSGVGYQPGGCDSGSIANTIASNFWLVSGSQDFSTIIIDEDDYHLILGAAINCNGKTIDIEDYNGDNGTGLDDTNYYRWKDFCQAVSATAVPIPGPDAITGYGGHIIYREMISNYITPDGYDATTVVDSTFARFVGVE